ncbi:hypothetical protein BH10PLA1_BH10PLA1_02060 [soil metagenome]
MKFFSDFSFVWIAGETAASIASLLLTTDAVISEIKEDKEPNGGWPSRRRNGRDVLETISE